MVVSFLQTWPKECLQYILFSIFLIRKHIFHTIHKKLIHLILKLLQYSIFHFSNATDYRWKDSSRWERSNCDHPHEDTSLVTSVLETLQQMHSCLVQFPFIQLASTTSNHWRTIHLNMAFFLLCEKLPLVRITWRSLFA